MNTSFKSGIRWIRPGSAATALLALLAGGASAAKLSGTITIRNGDTQGPFRIFVVRVGFPGIVAGSALRTTPGTWEASGLADGTYFVLGWADQNDSSTPDRTEPVGFHGSAIPTRVVVSGGHNVTGVDVVLEPIALGAELSGRVVYNGGARGRIWVFPHLGPDYEPLNIRGLPWTITAPGDYSTFAFQNGEYSVSAYIDVNGNLFHDEGEPIGTSHTVDVNVRPSAAYANLDIVIRDRTTAVQGRTWSQVKALYQD